MTHSSKLARSLLFLSVVGMLAACPREQKPPPRPAPDLSVRPDLLPSHSFHATAREALAAVLKRHRPTVVGFGELHRKTSDATAVVSALERFRGELLAELAARHASDLVVETWVTAGRCGAQEKRVARKVEQTTERPAETEGEVVRLLKRAKALGLQPHILTVGCEEYDRLLGKEKKGELDFEKLLAMITRHLRDKTAAVLKHRRRGKRAPLVAVYGGALHNDLFPMEELKAYSFAAALQKATDGRYVELDLYVPELLDADELLKKNPWFSQVRAMASPKRVLLLERGPGSYILVLRKGRTAPAQ